MNADGMLLAGLGVLVTRPEHQAEGLRAQIEQRGGTAYRFPVMEICSPRDSGPLRAVTKGLDVYDWAIFISVNAVDRALRHILAVRDWPEKTRIAVIGRSSAQALESRGLKVDLIPPDRYDSEALLVLPEMNQVSGQKIVVFRGEGGRELLADTLRKRGARVDYIEAYRRERPLTDPAPLLAQWSDEIDIVVVNSGESLKNLVALLGEAGCKLAQQTPLLVVSERHVPLARQLGFESEVVVADNATDSAVVRALCDWRKINSK